MASVNSQTVPRWGASRVAGFPRRCGGAGFTLVEFLATVLIVAVLLAGAIYFTACYVQWAKLNTEHEIYAVLNDELTRYKGNGGNINALTVGAPIGDIFAALKTPVVPAGMPASFSQQFMATGYTYPGRSLQAMGSGEQYSFYQVDQYVGSTPGPGVLTSKYPTYGQGIGYVANGGASAYTFNISTSTGYWAWKATNGTITGPLAQGNSLTVPTGNTSFTFWSCSSGSNTPSGNVTSFDCNNITGIDVSGLTGLTLLAFRYGGVVTTLNVSGLASLQNIQVQSNNLSMINASGCKALTTLLCYYNNLGTINITGDTNLPASCVNASTTFQVQGNPSLTIIGP